MSEKKCRTQPPKEHRQQALFLFCSDGAASKSQICFKLQEKATQKYELFETVYGNKNLVRTFTKGGKYSEARENFAVDARSGRLSTARNSQTVANVSELVIRDHRMAPKLMDDLFQTDCYTTCLLIRKKFGRRKICAKFLPHSFRDEQKEAVSALAET
jgi:hypothetical protein